MGLCVDNGVVKTEGICGGSARIAGTRIPVWTIIALQIVGVHDREILESYPHLVQADLQAARDYYHRDEINRDEINEDLRRNARPDDA